MTLTRSPLNSPRFIIANFYTVACTPHGCPTWPTMLLPPHSVCILSCPTARWFVHVYIYIYLRFVMNFQRIRPRFLRHVGWNNVAPGKVRSFERLRATLNSSNTAEQFSSAIDDLLPLLYFSKIFRIYRSSTSSFAPLSFLLQPLPFFNFS